MNKKEELSNKLGVLRAKSEELLEIKRLEREIAEEEARIKNLERRDIPPHLKKAGKSIFKWLDEITKPTAEDKKKKQEMLSGGWK